MKSIGLILIKLIELAGGLIVGALLIRFLLRLFAANGNAKFVAWVYEITAPLVNPFKGLVKNFVFENGLTIEVTTLIAMFVYFIVGYVLIRGLSTLFIGQGNIKK